MASLATAARALSRSSSAVPRTAVRCLSTTAARPAEGSTSSYQSPFKGEQTTTNVPDFGHYAAKNSPNTNLVYQYFMVGAMGTIAAAGAKSTIQGERLSRIGVGRMRKGWQRTQPEAVNWSGARSWGCNRTERFSLGDNRFFFLMCQLEADKVWFCRVPEEHVRIRRCLGHG